MNLNPIAGIIEAVGSVAADLVTTDKERLDAEIELRKLGLDERRIDQATDLSQINVNTAEAAHASVWVSGWRPGVGWVSVAGLAYNFLAHPFLLWLWALLQAQGWVSADLSAPPPVDVEALLVLLGGILGLGVYRTAEKVKGVSK